MSIKLYSLIFASLILFACADESPTSTVQDNISEKEQRKQKEKQEEDCYYGTGNYSDSWCCTNYGYQCNTAKSSSSSYYNYYYSSSTKKLSSSSFRSNYSSSSAVYYLTTSKNMKLTLTYFKQVTPDWDNVLGLGNYADADPNISFDIEFIDTYGIKTTKKTDVMLKKQDTGLWSGRVDYTTTVPVNTETIRIYPKITDADVLASDDYSSKYWYITYDVGYIKNNNVQYQSDYENKNCIIEWEWYLY
jgi:hypothetical protein